MNLSKVMFWASFLFMIAIVGCEVNIYTLNGRVSQLQQQVQQLQEYTNADGN